MSGFTLNRSNMVRWKEKWANCDSNGWLHPPRRKTRCRWPCWRQYESCWRRRCTGRGSDTFLTKAEEKKNKLNQGITPGCAATGWGNISCNLLSCLPLRLIICSNTGSQKRSIIALKSAKLRNLWGKKTQWGKYGLDLLVHNTVDITGWLRKMKLLKHNVKP